MVSPLLGLAVQTQLWSLWLPAGWGQSKLPGARGSRALLEKYAGIKHRKAFGWQGKRIFLAPFLE